MTTMVLSFLASLAIQGSGAPADPQLQPESRRLLQYLHSIYGKQVIYGQSTNHGPGVGEYPNAVADFNTAGKYPAMVSIDLYGWNSPRWGDNYRGVLKAYVDGAKAWWQVHHGLVTMQYHWGNPLNPAGSAWVDSSKGAVPPDVSKIVTPGTPENKEAMEDLHRTADYMQELSDAHIPILFRPLHEINGGWFWWTDRQKPESTAALYRMMFDYLVGQRHFHNLIWIFNAGDNKDSADTLRRFYPGDRYVDIAGVDIYSDQVGQDFHNDAYQNYYDLIKQVAPGKMLALCECNSVPNPKVMEAKGPRWLYCLAWWAPGKDNPADWVKQVLNDPFMITLEKLPKRLF